jgi:hypothetical protein
MARPKKATLSSKRRRKKYSSELIQKQCEIESDITLMIHVQAACPPLRGVP